MSAEALELSGRRRTFHLPVRLSAHARRQALMATGLEPDSTQLFVIDDLTELELSDRTRLLDLWDRVNVKSIEDRPLGEFRNDGYEVLLRRGDGRWDRYWPDTEGDYVDLERVFFAAPGRTVSLLEREMSGRDDRETVDAMLAGFPLVSDLGEVSYLTLDRVLDAYDSALEVARRIVALCDSATAIATSFWPGSPQVTEDGVFFVPDCEEERVLPAAVLKESDQDAYEAARQLLAEADSSKASLTEAIDTICARWWSNPWRPMSDAARVERVLRPYIENAIAETRKLEREREATEHYERCRANWIAKHGSTRLKRAAHRGYRHDGIYRDERLAIDLPGFVGTLGRKSKTRELVNPSADALQVEEETLARTESLGIDDAQVRLVFASSQGDYPWPEGEFVEIASYLGRHTVWKRVRELADDDIPF